MKDLREHQKGVAVRAIKNYRLGFKSTDDEQRIEYFKKASMELVGGLFTPQEKTRVLSEAFKGYESLVEKVAKEFDTRTPERIQTLMNKVERKQ
jgi:predicted Zn-dependent protease